MGFAAVELVASPHHPPPPVRTFGAAAMWAAGRTLDLCFRLETPLDDLRLLPSADDYDGDPLWKHTCLEAFVGVPGQPGYLEFNFAPAGLHTVFDFEDYRRQRSSAAPVGVELGWDHGPDWIELESRIRLDDWLSDPPELLEVGLSAVLEDRDENTSFWAARHSSKGLDFHDRETFVLQLKR